MKFLLRENINKEAMAIVHQPSISNLVSSIKLTMLFVSSAIEKTKKKALLSRAPRSVVGQLFITTTLR
jgi:methyl coenzyme M reductase beta subunit